MFDSEPNKDHRLRVLTGKQLLRFLTHNGFVIKQGHASGHLKLEKKLVNGKNQNVIMTNKKNESISKGSLKEIYAQVAGFIPQFELDNFFFTGFESVYKEKKLEVHQKENLLSDGIPG